jgi:hypothetical protein
MLDDRTSAIKKGTGETPRHSHTSKVTGAISSTVVRLSKRAEATAVMSTTPAKGELPCC